MTGERPGSRIDSSVFEGLFERALDVKGAFAEELRRLGYDRERPEPSYPAPVFRQALDVAARFVHPTLDLAAAHRELGRQCIDGYLQTLVGKVLAVSLPLIGPHRLVMRGPRYLAMGRPGLNALIQQTGPSTYRLEVREDGSPVPHYIAGLIERALVHAQAEAHVEPARIEPEGYDVEISW